MMTRGLTLFFPMYNERENISNLLDRVESVMPTLQADDIEILIIDDGSSDGCEEIVRQRAEKVEQIRLIQHSENKGYGSALRTGFQAASRPLVFYSDSDLPADLAEVTKTFPLLDEADIVIGYRIKRHETFRRAVYSKIYNQLMRILFGVRVRDVNFSFKIVKKEVLDRIHLTASSVFIDGQLLAEATKYGFRIAEIPIDYTPRKVGASSFDSFGAAWDTLMEMLRYWKGPFRERSDD